MIQNNQSVPRIIIALSLLLFDCVPDNSSSKISSEIRKLVFPTNCKNACWMGIEPKVSTVDEALEILEKNYGSENVIYNENAIVATWGAHNANWYDRVSLFYSNNVVNSIDIWLSKDSNVEVKSFISEIGNPEDVVLLAFGSCTTASLVYPKKGLDASISSFGISVGVSENRTIDTLAIYPPWIPKDSKNMKFVPWEGYRDYCPEKWSEKE